MSRWKKFVLVFLGVVALCALLGYAFRRPLASLIIQVAMGDFDPAKAPPAPDYAQASAWAALPEKVDASDRVPDGLVETPSPTRDLADVFYIHPTGYNGRENWNATVGEESNYAIPTSVMLAAQANAFNGCGKVYAPEYRQASIFAYAQVYLAPQRGEGKQAFDLAYSDVTRAFDYFIEHYSHGKPFIIASHSQGSMHALRLLMDKIDGTPLYPRLIAAYLIGGTIPADFFERVFKEVKPCISPTEAGCLIAWDTIREGAFMPRMGLYRYPQGWEYLGDKQIYCVNPLTWTPGAERAPASANGGALMASFVPLKVHPDGCEFKGLSPQHTWAQCHDGRLWVADQPEGAFHDRFGIYHLFDYGLFWMNIRENARIRAETYLRAHGQLAG